jgi:tetratricopeptide (TPR) repeat protein
MKTPRSSVLAILLLCASAGVSAQRPTAAELDKAGWAAIKANRLQEAAEAFGEALRLEPRNVRLMLGAGVTAHLMGRIEEARQQLVAALQVQPSMTEASILLGQLLYRDGDVAGAIQVYEQALVHSPDNPSLAPTLEKWRQEIALHDSFTSRFGDHFTVMFEGPKEEALAGKIIEMLEASYWRIGSALGAYPNGILTVVLYTNEQFRDVTRSPTWAVAAFDGRIRVPLRGAIDNPRELDRVLAHEFTHALVYSIAPRGVPQWLNEGLAQLFEPERGPAPDLTGPPIPLKQLERTFEGLDDAQAKQAYGQSLAAVQALVERAGMTGALNLLSFVGQGVAFADAFERAVFVSFAEFQASWAAPRLPLGS